MTGIGFGGGIDLYEEQLISMGLSVNAMLCCADVGRETMSSQLAQLAQCNCSEGYRRALLTASTRIVLMASSSSLP